MTLVYIATEDSLSEAAVNRLISDVNQEIQVIPIRQQGFGYLKQKLPQLLNLADKLPVILLTDLDQAECPATLIADWLGNRNLPENMLFRVAVRETEAWLLADRKNFADFCGAPLDKIPIQPELLNNPKQTLLNIIKQYSNKRDLKADVLPAKNSSTAKIGLGYNQRLSQFVRELWSLQHASENADSLRRTQSRLNELLKSLS